MVTSQRAWTMSRATMCQSDCPSVSEAPHTMSRFNRQLSLLALVFAVAFLAGCSGKSAEDRSVESSATVAECVEQNEWTPARCKDAKHLDMLCDDARPTCGRDDARSLQRCRVLVEQDKEFAEGKVLSCAGLLGAFGLCPNGETGGRSTPCRSSGRESA